MFESVIPLIRENDNFLLTSHINPEGDSFGSLFAMSLFLEKLGKNFMVVCDDEIPGNMSFLNKEWLCPDEVEPWRFDWVIVLDALSLDRLGRVKDLISNNKNIIVIDHHIGNAEFSLCSVIDSNASSCGELLYYLFCEAGVEIDKDVAELLYIAISTDTGNFKYSNTTSKVHKIVADLIDRGAAPAYLSKKVFLETTYVRLKLLSRFLENMSLEFGGRCCYSYLDESDLAKFCADKSDTEGFVNHLVSVKGVEVAFFMTSFDKSGIKVSFRSAGIVDVNKIASLLGGGGHRMASGVFLEGNNLDDAKVVVLGLLRGELES